MHHRDWQRRCEIGRLIEATIQPAPWMERDGHHARGVLQQVAAGLAQQFAERGRERPACVVLEGVNDVAKCAVVLAGGSGGFNRTGRPSSARRAHRPRRIEDAPRGQHPAAGPAKGWDWTPDARPAARADRASERVFEYVRASGTDRCEYDGQQRVCDAEDRVTGAPRRQTRAARRCPRGARVRRTLGTHG